MPERKRAARRRIGRQSGPSAADLFDAAPLPLMYTDGDMVLVLANAAWLRIVDDSGAPRAVRDRLIGARFTEHVIPADREICAEIHAAHMQLQEGGEPRTPSVVDIHFAWCPAAPPAHTMATTILGADGCPAGVLFASCPWERSKTYTGSELLRSSTDISAVRRLVSALSHEVNNPLFIVSATLEDLLAEVSDPQIATRLKVALDNVWRISDKVKEMLDGSRAGDWSAGPDPSS